MAQHPSRSAPPERLPPDKFTPGARGKLKIFFGYAPGVGKTSAMLKAAAAAKNAGTDMTVGCVGSALSSAASAQNMEFLPPLVIPGAQGLREEFDLDGALKRRPQLVVLGALAHRNADGCRHLRRYQDAEELLKAGIDVYATLSVQHIESLGDIVASITGEPEPERIPDSVFDGADQVELVDIEPDELMKRQSRKTSSDAVNTRSRTLPLEKLIALRELALRRAAVRVNRVSEQYRTAAKNVLSADEHIMVCLSGSPTNAKVIRTAARMAEAFCGSLTALYVERPDGGIAEDSAREQLRGNLKLAEQLGARIATIYGEDIAAQIAEYAKASGVSKIVIGRSTDGKRGPARRPALVERLIALAPYLDIYIIPEALPPKASRSRPGSLRLSMADTLKTAGILCLVSLAGFWFDALGLSEANIVTVYILGVLLTAMATSGILYGLIASFLSVVTFNFLFTDPRFTLRAYNPDSLITFSVMFIAAFATGTLTMRVRDQARQAAQKAHRTEVLLETSQMLQRAKNREEIFAQTARQMRRLLDRTVIFYPVSGDALEPPAFFPKDEEAEGLSHYASAGEREVAQWVFRNQKHAGAGTNTHSGAKCLYMAVRSQHDVYAVAGIALENTPSLGAFEKNLLISLLGECALALEKEEMSDTKNRIAIQAQREQLRANLLRAISHDLRTPLTSISGNAGILMDSADLLGDEKKRRLYADIYEDATWLIDLVENLLSVTRIENGTMDIRREPELIEEVIREVLSHIGRKGAEHRITVDLEDDMLMAQMDPRLIIQVMINILDNAVKYTPPGSHISIGARRDGPMVLIEIADDGEGIPEDRKEKLFDMHFSADKLHSDRRRGLGLGLSLCRSIVQAHGGVIGVRDNQPRGSVFFFTLPAQEVKLP